MRPKPLNQTIIKLIVAFHRGRLRSFVTRTPTSPYCGGVQSACLHLRGVLYAYMMLLR